MDKYEKLLMEVARKEFKQFSFRPFKRANPELLKVIIESMHLCYLKGHNDGRVKITDEPIWN